METTRLNELVKISGKVRLGIIEATYQAGSGHPGGALSSADVLTYLYFNELNVRPDEPAY